MTSGSKGTVLNLMRELRRRREAPIIFWSRVSPMTETMKRTSMKNIFKKMKKKSKLLPQLSNSCSKSCSANAYQIPPTIHGSTPSVHYEKHKQRNLRLLEREPPYNQLNFNNHLFSQIG